MTPKVFGRQRNSAILQSAELNKKSPVVRLITVENTRKRMSNKSNKIP